MKTAEKMAKRIQLVIRRNGAIFIILAGILFLTACGKEKQEADKADYLFVSHPIQEAALSGGYSMDNCNFHVSEKYLYFLDSSLYRIPIENGLDFHAREEVISHKDLFQYQDERASREDTSSWNDVLCFTVDDAENIYYCTTSYDEMRIILYKCSADGTLVYQIPMEPEQSLSGYGNTPFLAADDEENAYILTANSIRRYDSQGNLTENLTLDEDFDDDFMIHKSLMEASGGQIYFIADSYIDSSRKAYRVSADSTMLLESLESLSEAMCMSTLYQGLNGPLIGETDDWLYQYNTEDQSMEPILRWEDSDIYKNDIFAVVQVTDELLLLVTKDDSQDAAGLGQSLTLLVRTPADEVPVKERIVLAALFPTSDLQEAVVRFNRNSSLYHVTIERYGADIMSDDNEGAFTRLDSSLTSKDNPPDLLDFTDLDVWKYAEAGALEDLNSYIGTDGSIWEEDFLGNLLEGYTINGRLICIPKAFNFMAAWIADERALEAEDWSIESLMAVADKYEDVSLFPAHWDQPDVMLRLFFSDYILDKFIDRETGKCLLDSEEFCSLLEWVKAQTSQKDTSRHSLLKPQFINSFEKYHQALTDSEEQMTLRGLPSICGKPAFQVSVDNALGITENSRHKEGAWEFLQFFLQHERDIKYSVYTYRFPTKLAILDQITEDITTPNYETIDGEIMYGADGNPIINPESAVYSDGIYHEYYAMEESDADILRELIDQIDFTPRSGMEQSIISIIIEESAAFFEGKKTAAQAADIIQNRAQTVISENQ
ncbi:MAG TPA: hypothetical protein DCZ91_15920 [Lachnospiraceae bacterium]|nr:hypothetical protein [Lachnospiraceae bacterium]